MSGAEGLSRRTIIGGALGIALSTAARAATNTADIWAQQQWQWTTPDGVYRSTSFGDPPAVLSAPGRMSEAPTPLRSR